jgi:predicted short-subunit dehydrogenase-like oxidoreductase (DUF2520 family)
VSVLVVGRGKVGRSLHRALVAASIDATLRRGRSRRISARGCSVVLLAVPDPHIEGVARCLVALERGAVVAHLAGALDPSALAFLEERGARVARAHPMLSFPRVLEPAALAGGALVLTGARLAVQPLARLARSLGMRPVLVRDLDAPRYHLGAALLANGAVALAAEVERIWLSAGVPRSALRRLLGPLLGSVAANLGERGASGALSGPIARGDLETIRRHLDVLPSSRTRELYLALASLQLDLAHPPGDPKRAPIAKLLRAARGAGSPARLRR